MDGGKQTNSQTNVDVDDKNNDEFISDRTTKKKEADGNAPDHALVSSKTETISETKEETTKKSTSKESKPSNEDASKYLDSLDPGFSALASVNAEDSLSIAQKEAEESANDFQLIRVMKAVWLCIVCFLSPYICRMLHYLGHRQTKTVAQDESTGNSSETDVQMSERTGSVVIKSSNSNSKKIGDLTKLCEPVKDIVTSEDSLFATLYVAAPRVVNSSNLIITGASNLLAELENPHGVFQETAKISNGIYIFQKTIPVSQFSPGSSIKLVQFKKADKKICYEIGGKIDSRTEKILPGSTNFFLYKFNSKSRSMHKKELNGLSRAFNKTKTKQKIATEFFNIMFDHVGNIKPDWDATAYESINNSLEQIQRAIGTETEDSFLEFLNQRFKNPDQKFELDQLLLLVIAANKIGNYSGSMKSVILKNSKEFRLFLHRIICIKSIHPGFVSVLENFALEMGPDFWWILFRFDCLKEKLSKYEPEKVSESTIKTMQEIPEVLLSNAVVASEVIDYLVKWNDIDELYKTLAISPSCYPLNTLLLEKSFIYKTHFQILRSDLLMEVFRNCQSTITIGYINIIFNKRFEDIVELISHVPDDLRPVIEDNLDKKLTAISNFNEKDYAFFARLDLNLLNQFPIIKRQIQEKLLEMTREHIKSDSFQNIPSLRLVLWDLSTKTDLLLLDRPKLADLQTPVFPR